METHHERIEKLLMLPDVLIVNLERFQTSRSGRTTMKNCADIEPSIVVTINETIYSLNAVATHYGPVANAGHYVTTLHKNSHWIDCDDEVVKSTKKAPTMGYLFFYDRVSEVPLGHGPYISLIL